MWGGCRCGCFITYWISSEVLSKDILEASKIMETLEEVDRLVCGSMTEELVRGSEEVGCGLIQETVHLTLARLGINQWMTNILYTINI